MRGWPGVRAAFPLQSLKGIFRKQIFRYLFVQSACLFSYNPLGILPISFTLYVQLSCHKGANTSRLYQQFVTVHSFPNEHCYVSYYKQKEQMVRYCGRYFVNNTFKKQTVVDKWGDLKIQFCYEFVTKLIRQS